MQELSRAGAAVLNAEAVQFAKDARIALHARSTSSPEGRGTEIRQVHASSADPAVIGVAGATDRRLLSLPADAIPGDARILSSLGGACLIAPGSAAPLPATLGRKVGTATVVCSIPDATRAAALAALRAVGAQVYGEIGSPCALTFVIDPEQVDHAVGRLHADLVERTLGP